MSNPYAPYGQPYAAASAPSAPQNPYAQPASQPPHYPYQQPHHVAQPVAQQSNPYQQRPAAQNNTYDAAPPPAATSPVMYQTAPSQPYNSRASQQTALAAHPDGEPDYTKRYLCDNSHPWLDWWAALIFVVHLLIVVIVAYFMFKDASNEDKKEKQNQAEKKNSSGSDDLSESDRNSLLVVIIVCGFGLSSVLAGLWLQLQKTRALETIWVSMVTMLCIMVLLCILAFLGGNIVGFIFALIFLLFFCLFFYFARKRFPFAAALLEESTILVRKFPGTIGAAVVGLFAQLGWMLLLAYASMAVVRVNNLLVLILFVFSFYWTSQFIKSSVHVTAINTFGSWYFLSPSVPSWPTVKGAWRALTKLAGPVAFGSAIIAAIQTLRYIVRTMKHNAEKLFGRSFRLEILFCMLDCIIGCIEGLAKRFNHYAYVQVVVYAKPYIRAARDTWELAQTSGVSGLISDNITGICVVIAALGVGLISAITAGLWVGYGNSNYRDRWLIAALVCFFLGMIVMYTVGVVVESALATIFVCWAQEPTILQQQNPDFHENLQSAMQGDYESIAQRRKNRKSGYGQTYV